jgi:exodeoxyribonuclease VII large subunit
LSNQSYISLSELNQKIEEHINLHFSDLFFWVLAEVSSHKFYQNSDRHYFDLVEKSKDSNIETAKIKAKSWSDGSEAINMFEKNTGQKFQNGIQVLVQVKVEYHRIYGLSLTLYNIDSSFTLGNIERQKQATLLKLVNDNSDFIKLINDEYHTKNKQMLVPSVIQKIALIASPNSEGYQDFIHTLINNQFNYTFSVDHYFSSVQGGDAEKELVNKLISIYESKIDYDVVVLVRGGGAKIDFMVFDSYLLSKAVAKFPIPIITGIGHHQDVSIVDLMAHTSTKTPTKVAELIIANNRFFEEKINSLEKKLIISLQQTIQNNQEILQSSRNTINLHTYEVIKHHSSRLISLKQDLISESNFKLKSEHKELLNIKTVLISRGNDYIKNKLLSIKNIESIAKTLDPRNILKRGFSILTHEGKIVFKNEDLQKLDKINIETFDSEIEANISSLKKKTQNG